MRFLLISPLLAFAALAFPQDDLLDVEEERSPVDAALLARSEDPADPALLEAVARAYAEEGDADGELAYLLLAADAVEKTEYDSEKEKSRVLEALVDEIEDRGAGLKAIKKARDSYLNDLTWALRLYAKNQEKFRNALLVGSRILDYRPDHPRANSELKIMRRKLDAELSREADRLLGQQDLRRPRRFLRAWAEEHRTWERAGSFEGERYDVKTNAGYDVGQVALKSLEAIADYYEQFYDVDRALVSRRTPVNICRTHEEFRAIADWEATSDPGLLAFIRKVPRRTSSGDVELEFEVFGYDPRAFGRPLEGLWATLWHEASHEYMGLVTEERVAPIWFNEGMSSYFEGVTFSEKGEIGVGLPAMRRLEVLEMMLERGDRPLRATIEALQVLTAEQYSVAWGLVYYLIHGRGEDGTLLRPAALPEAMEVLGSRMITGPGLLDLVVLSKKEQTLEEFELEWIAAMRALFAAEEDPIGRAQELVELGDRRVEAGDLADGLGLYGEALLRDRESLEALDALARVHRELWLKSRKRDDRAADEVLLWARRLRRAATELGEPDLAEEADGMCREVDRTGDSKIAKAEEKYRRRIEALLKRMTEEGRPRSAVALCGLYLDDVLGIERARDLAIDLRLAGSLTLERPISFFSGSGLDGLTAPTGVFSVEEGMLTGRAVRPRQAGLFLERSVDAAFRFEGYAQLGDANVVLGVVASSPEGGVNQGFALRPRRPKGEARPEMEYRPFDEVQPGKVRPLTQRSSSSEFFVRYHLDGRAVPAPAAVAAGSWFQFALTHDEPGVLTLSIDGETVAETDFAPGASLANVGLVLYGGEANFVDLTVYELDRL